jgi:hypothetical protein
MDAVRRTQLAEPFADWWIEAYTDPPIGDFLDMRTAANEATAEPTEAKMDALVATLARLIKSHNMTNRDGSPLEFVLRAMPARLIAAISGALQSGGEPADPLSTPASLLEPASPAKRSRRNTRSGD